MINGVLCSISTRGRYDTTLPLAIQSVINQTHKVDKLIIYDDNDSPRDLRESQLYNYLFQLLEIKGIKWEVLFAQKKGQHWNHQMANTHGYTWVWRIDDDCVAEPNTLHNLILYAGDKVGAVGGSILTPPVGNETLVATGSIRDIFSEPNLQWGYIRSLRSVDHLHCSFLYRAGVYDYNLALSRAAHREETLFTYGLKQKGYEILVVPDAITWHLKNKEGGIRLEQEERFHHDEAIFRNFLKFKDKTIVVLDNGMGDHIVFSHVLPLIENPVVFSCYPDIVPGRSIQEAKDLFGDISTWNIYNKMMQWDWKGSLESAFNKLYVEKP